VTWERLPSAPPPISALWRGERRVVAVVVMAVVAVLLVLACLKKA